MSPSKRNTSSLSSEPKYITAGGTGNQGHPPPRQQVANEAYGVLLIGSHATIEAPIIGLREILSYQPFIHSSYDMPTDTVLARIRIVYGYDLGDIRRENQLRYCSRYQRKHGGIQTIYAFLRPSDVDIAERVENFGARVVGVPTA